MMTRVGHRIAVVRPALGEHGTCVVVDRGGGLIVEHWANRDDLGMARQLGGLPSTPVFLFRMSMAKRRGRRDETANTAERDGRLTVRWGQA